MKIQWTGKLFLFCVLSLSSLSGMATPAVTPTASPSVTQATPATNTPPKTQAPTTTGPSSATTPVPAANANKATPPTPNAAPKASGLEPIAQVIWVKGTIKAAQPGAPERTLERRSVIYEHDLITTTPGSTGQIAFTDNSVVSLSENTQLKVDAYKYNKTLEDRSVMELIKGGFRTITGAIPKENPDSYQVKTPVATIGVRGTDYTAFYSTAKGLVLNIDQGKIVVSNPLGSIQMSACTAGGGVTCYGAVTSQSIRPKLIQKMPAVFTTKPVLTPVPANMGAPGQPAPTATPGKNDTTPTPAAATTGPGGPSGPGPTPPGSASPDTTTPGSTSPSATPSNGPSKTVNSFCIGKNNKRDTYPCPSLTKR